MRTEYEIIWNSIESNENDMDNMIEKRNEDIKRLDEIKKLIFEHKKILHRIKKIMNNDKICTLSKLTYEKIIKEGIILKNDVEETIFHNVQIIK